MLRMAAAAAGRRGEAGTEAAVLMALRGYSVGGSAGRQPQQRDSMQVRMLPVLLSLLHFNRGHVDACLCALCCAAHCRAAHYVHLRMCTAAVAMQDLHMFVALRLTVLRADVLRCCAEPQAHAYCVECCCCCDVTCTGAAQPSLQQLVRESSSDMQEI